MAARARASSRSTGSTRARSSCACATAARCARPRSPTSALDVDEALDAGPRAADDGGRGARRRRSRRPSRTSTATTGALRVAVVDYGAKRSILRRLAGAGAAVTVFPHDVDADELAGFDGVAPLERPRRPRAARRRGRRSCASCSAACPCSASASATSCSASRPATRRTSCRSATAARTTRCSSGAAGRVLVTSQNHGFAVAPREERRGDARLALRRHRRGLRLPRAARALGAVPPRGRARAARRLADPRALGRGGAR